MAFQVQKHEAKQLVDFSDNTGGMNISLEQDKIAENECVDATNFQLNFNTGKFCTRPAIGTPIVNESEPITKLWYDSATRMVYFFVGKNNAQKTIKSLDGSGVVKTLGKTTGTVNRPNCLNFGGNIFFATGRKLQAYLVTPPQWLTNYRNQLVTLDGSSTSQGKLCNSPNADLLYYKSGRIICAASGDDTIYYSAVSDALSEKAIGIEYDDPDDDSSAKYISNVGADDAGKFLSILPMSTDIVVFKTSGNVYTVSGEVNNWYISLVGTNSDAVDMGGILTFNNDIAFISTQGLRKLTNSATYGNYAAEEFGQKCNPEIMDGISSPWLADLRDRRQLIISKNNHSALYVFHYNYGAFTKWTFADNVTINDIEETQNGVLVAGERDGKGFLSYLTDTLSKDFNADVINQSYTSRLVHDYDLLNSHINNIQITRGENSTDDIMFLCNNNVLSRLSGDNVVKHIRAQVRDETLQYKVTTTARINLEHLSATVIQSADGSGASRNGNQGQWTSLADSIMS